MARKKQEILWFMAAILLMGAFLRWAQLGTMEEMLNSDEAANGLDALSLIQSPRLTPFFPSYTGRESGWHYWLVPYLMAFGLRPFAIRLAATMAGVMTLAAVYPLSRELLPKRAALWSTAALAVLYWHVHLSHIGFRAILFPMIGSLAMALLLRAHRQNTPTTWLGAGIMLGLLPYSYFSARLWLGYAGLMMIYWGVQERSKRRGILLTGGIAAVLSLPLLLYTYLNPDASLNRIGEVSILNLDGISKNMLAWLGAWFHLGDQNVMLNLPGRPILDWYLAIPFLVGLACLWKVIKARWFILWIAGLAVLSVIPSLFSDHAPHFLRAIGLVIPVALIIGAGLYNLEIFIKRYAGRASVLVPFFWLLAASGTVYETFSEQWLKHPDLYDQMEIPINQAARIVKQVAPLETPVYFAPISRLHPTFLFRAAELAPRHVIAFDSDQCWVRTAVPAVYVLIANNRAAQVQPFTPWANTQIWREGRSPAGEGAHNYLILSATPFKSDDDQTRMEIETAVFGDALQIEPSNPLPDRVKVGETIAFNLNFQAIQPVAGNYHLFIHLYGTPSPYEGGPIWTQIDSPICPSYPMVLWQPFETINQQFELLLPADMPPGDYTLVTGLYKSPDGPRLSLTAPATNPWNHFELQRIEVVSPAG